MSEAEQTPVTQRLFFALWPDEALRSRLAVLLRSPGQVDGRAVALENLHLTLAFLGNLLPEQRQCMVAWANAMAWQPFELILDRFGHWPAPRVAWLGPTQWPAELDALVASLAEGMRHCGLKPDPHPYTPHITLLRKARSQPRNSSSLPIHWPVSSLVLCESCSGSQGVTYRVLRRWEQGTGNRE